MMISVLKMTLLLGNDRIYNVYNTFYVNVFVLTVKGNVLGYHHLIQFQERIGVARVG